MWQMYCVIFRLRSPLHIGWNKIGNVQRTRPYVTGRTLWGALTMRMTRDEAYTKQQPTSARDYPVTGHWVHRNLAFTYLYPAIQKGQTNGSPLYEVIWPWQEQFAHRFLSSYASTALTHPAQSATEGTLHEVEFLSPTTIDTGEPVYLVGYMFSHRDMNNRYNAIQHALQRLQIGGERTYGWGRLELQDCISCTDMALFSDIASVDVGKERPRLHINNDNQLLAHTNTTNIQAHGEIEPLVGREWRQSAEAKYSHVGQYVACNGVCFAPGARVVTSSVLIFQIGEYGVWEQCT